MGYFEDFEVWKQTLGEEAMSELASADDIKEAFYTPLSFGTAGMRGIVGMGTGRMNLYTVGRATKGLCDYVNSIGEAERGVVIAYDTRRYSLEFAVECARILSANKIKTYLYENVRPVPMISFALRQLKCIAGIMITASHNPKQYNGYKVYGDDGAQMSPEATAKVVGYIESCPYFGLARDELRIQAESDIHGQDGVEISDYVTIIGASIDEQYYAAISKLTLSPEAVEHQRDKLKIVYTPLHGAGAIPVTTILARMGIPVTTVPEQALPDTEFSTVSVPNPEQPDALRLGIALAEKIDSNVVIGTDPDCDRMGVAVKNADGQFVLLTGNQIGALLMDYILMRNKALGRLRPNAAVVKTIVTTSLAKQIAESYGATCFDVLTGFKFIGEKIKEWEKSGAYTFYFGYEESYGYLSGTHARDKDAVVASMLFAEMVCYYRDEGTEIYARLQELMSKFGFYRDMSVSMAFSGVDGMRQMADIMHRLHGLQIDNIAGEPVDYTSDYMTRVTTYYDGKRTQIYLPKTDAIYYGLMGGNWLCVRPSGTEPKLKIYVSISGKSPEDADNRANRLIEWYKRLL